MNTNKSFLSPYRVLDLTDEKGYMCGKILGGLGAEVIKTEPPGGDPGRKTGPLIGDTPAPNGSLPWIAFNVNKKSITLDLKTREGRQTFMRLVETADFLVESFQPGYLDRLSLGYDKLREKNPSIVLTCITPYGQTGPYCFATDM
jgi:crotonobetainyl-CoA:carnitine CoA-transferase CaiB-like acyl-CoA transferase